MLPVCLLLFGGLVFANTRKHKRIGHAEILNFWTKTFILILSYFGNQLDKKLLIFFIYFKTSHFVTLNT